MIFADLIPEQWAGLGLVALGIVAFIVFDVTETLNKWFDRPNPPAAPEPTKGESRG